MPFPPTLGNTNGVSYLPVGILGHCTQASSLSDFLIFAPVESISANGYGCLRVCPCNYVKETPTVCVPSWESGMPVKYKSQPACC